MMAIALLGCALDFLANVLVVRDLADRNYQSPPLVEPRVAVNEASSVQSVAQWLGASPSMSANSEELVLEGIIWEGSRLRAIVRSGSVMNAAGPRVAVAVGDQVSGWQVVNLDRQSLILKKADEERRMTLFRKEVGADQS